MKLRFLIPLAVALLLLGYLFEKPERQAARTTTEAKSSAAEPPSSEAQKQGDTFVDNTAVLKQGEPDAMKDAWTTYLHNNGADHLPDSFDHATETYLARLDSLNAALDRCRSHDVDPSWVVRFREVLSPAEMKDERQQIGAALTLRLRQLKAACMGNVQTSALASEAELRTQVSQVVHLSKGFILSQPHEGSDIHIAKQYFDAIAPYAASPGPLETVLGEDYPVDPNIDPRVVQFFSSDSAFRQLFDILKAVKLLDASLKASD